jgi:hypothetical protein
MAKPNPLARGLEKFTAPGSPPPAAPAIKGRGQNRPGARKGQVLIGGFFAPEVHKQLKMIAVEGDITLQELLADALNTIFARAGKPEIARLGRILKAGDN